MSIDSAYRSVVDDIQRVLPENMEVTQITTVREKDGEYVEVGNEQAAEMMAVDVKLRDEYREPWWPVGEIPNIRLAFAKHFIHQPAGLAAVLRGTIISYFDVYKEKWGRSQEGVKEEATPYNDKGGDKLSDSKKKRAKAKS